MMVDHYPNTDPIITWRYKPDPEPLLRALGYLPLPIPAAWLEAPLRQIYKCRMSEPSPRGR